MQTLIGKFVFKLPRLWALRRAVVYNCLVTVAQVIAREAIIICAANITTKFRALDGRGRCSSCGFLLLFCRESIPRTRFCVGHVLAVDNGQFGGRVPGTDLTSAIVWDHWRVEVVGGGIIRFSAWVRCVDGGGLVCFDVL